jgi:hypothetical protein
LDVLVCKRILLCVAVAGCENKSTHPAASAKRFMRLKNEGDCIRGLKMAYCGSAVTKKRML